MKLKKGLIHLLPTERLYALDKPIIGLTGGIATGKSTVTKLLEAKGLSVIDADQLVKNIYQTIEAKDFIRLNYPEAWVNNGIDFKKLREIFFKNPQIKTAIESFIYARLPNAFHSEALKSPKQEFYIYDVPLLFERQMEKAFDFTVVVYAPRDIQRARIIIRDGHVQEMADTILSHQMDIEDKKLKADFVIDNSSSLTELTASLDRFLQQVLDA